MTQRIKALFAWTAQGEESAKLIGVRYLEAGLAVTFHGEAQKDELIFLGEKKDMTHVLYFIDHERLLLISLADEMGGFTVEVLVEDLILPC
ncbi:hypothetical protein [Anaerotignum propionicum]|uniref:Uncharacterized protein n=1 Tax=Anaerotignum propionicum DSM 1682 TaxID=991789 RepID=A0A120MK24_ANAPI|nr:hypothetical protein [Anaerotignum propionicum]AMJ39942.1 hypothetical protein CPRO_03200 [Anaerotignum propionicum DSM 1682]SHE27172.1 hypothetical protein SAMN02745151_00031 [[Clostridium] propionicum DSM 1682] [Anaerotignum propionicum DSM 1682]